ncbi:hypothetical protein ABPG77_006825, partial [Micractinium sp. CCAP 211/92]
MACALKAAPAVSGFTAKVQRQQAVRPAAARRLTTKAISDVNLVVGGCTVGALALGRFNDQTHFAAGDARAEEASFVLKTNDPAGFTIVDVMAWGALGHAAAFYLLATSSLGVDRNPSERLMPTRCNTTCRRRAPAPQEPLPRLPEKKTYPLYMLPPSVTLSHCFLAP